MIEKLKRKLWSLLGFIVYHTNSNILEVELWTPNDEASDSFKVRGLFIHRLGTVNQLRRDILGFVWYHKSELDYLKTRIGQ